MSFPTSVAQLDCLLRRHFPAAPVTCIPLAALTRGDFDGPQASFGRTFASLRRRLWVNSVVAVPEWIATFGAAIEDLVREAKSPDQSAAVGHFLAEYWLERFHIDDESQLAEVAESESGFARVYLCELVLLPYSERWLAPLNALSDEERESHSEGDATAVDNVGHSRTEAAQRPEAMADLRATIDRSAFARLLGVSTRTFDRMRQSRGFPKPITSKQQRPRWTRTVVEQWLQGQ